MDHKETEYEDVNWINLSEISGSNSGEYEDGCHD
jgi:hypothetical protein